MLFNDLISQEGIVMTSGEKWRKQRQLLAKFFHFEDLKNRVPIFAQICQKMVDSLQQFTENNQTFNTLDYAQICTARMIIATVLGNQFNDIQVNNQPMTIEIIDVMGKISFASRYHPYTFIRNQVWSCFYKDIPSWMLSTYEKSLLQRVFGIRNSIFKEIDIMEQKILNKETFNDEEKSRLTYVFTLEMLTDQTKSITKEDVLQNVLSVLLAAIDTSSHVFVMCLYFLGKYPHFVDKLLKEIDENIPDYKQVNFEQTKKLNLIQNFIDETMRFYTPAIMSFARLAIKDHYLADDLFIKKGTLVHIGILSGMSNPKYFPDPQQFNPDRFDKIKQLEPYVYIPFLSGPRNCLGQHVGLLEIKLMLIYFLKSFELKLKENYELKMRLLFVYEPDDLKFLNIKKKI